MGQPARTPDELRHLIAPAQRRPLDDELGVTPPQPRTRGRRLTMVVVDLDELEDLEALAEVAETCHSRNAEAMALAAFRAHALSLLPNPARRR